MALKPESFLEVHASKPNVLLRWAIDGQEDRARGQSDPGSLSFEARTVRLLVQAFKDGDLVLLGEDAPSPMFFGRRMMTSDLDVRLLKRWVTLCESRQWQTCNKSIIGDGAKITNSDQSRVVDVKACAFKF